MDFRGEQPNRETHASSTDPEALLFKKGASQATKLSHRRHLLTENRHGLVVDVELTPATGTAERAAALLMLERRGGRRVTLGADKAYDTRDFVTALRERGVTPHLAQHTSGRRSAVDRRTTRHAGTRGASDGASWWRKSSAGSRPWPGAANCATAGSRATGSGRSSPSRLTT